MRNEAQDHTFESISVGMKESFEHVVTLEEVDAFQQISGDYNPLHSEDSYAARTTFKKRVVHGMFLGALVSQLIGMKLPGKRTLLLKESLEFKKPVFIGDTVTVEGQVVSKSVSTRIIEIGISIERAGTLCVTGSVHVRTLE